MASYEAAHFVKTNVLEKFSEQELVDCVKTCYGCNGGNTILAFTYLRLHDAEYEASYPYTAKDGTCNYKASTGFRVSKAVQVAANDAVAMKAAVEINVVSVAIQAD